MKDENRRALLITIGVDTSPVNGGFRGPFRSENYFEYIPVPETKMYQCSHGKYSWTHEYVKSYGITYSKTKGNRLKAPLFSSMPENMREKFKDVAVHNDPNFEHLTYGDGRKKKTTLRGSQLAKLREDDLLVFCPSLENYETGDRGRFIIGYFTVKSVYDFIDQEFEKRYSCTRSEIINKYKDKNAHFSDAFARAWGWSGQQELLSAYERKEEDDFILVMGEEGQSGIFRKAIRITKPYNGKYFIMPKDLVTKLGLRKPPEPLRYERGWKWVEEKHFEKLDGLLEEGEGFI